MVSIFGGVGEFDLLGSRRKGKVKKQDIKVLNKILLIIGLVVVILMVVVCFM